MERETRFELATPTLARLCSTTELFPLVFIWKTVYQQMTCDPNLGPEASGCSTTELFPLVYIWKTVYQQMSCKLTAIKMFYY